MPQVQCLGAILMGVIDFGVSHTKGIFYALSQTLGQGFLSCMLVVFSSCDVAIHPKSFSILVLVNVKINHAPHNFFKFHQSVPFCYTMPTVSKKGLDLSKSLFLKWGRTNLPTTCLGDFLLWIWGTVKVWGFSRPWRKSRVQHWLASPCAERLKFYSDLLVGWERRV